ncbi:Uncharacterised protein at_DN1543 [Pycnogonum litorale]
MRTALLNEWTYLTRTTPCTEEELQPLENAISTKWIPALLDRPASADSERDLFALPAWLGGLGLTNPLTLIKGFLDSTRITEPLVNAIFDNTVDMDQVIADQSEAMSLTRKEKRDSLKTTREEVYSRLTSTLKRILNLASEKGASSWLNTIPLSMFGFTLHTRAFRDGVYLRYGWRPANIHNICACGKENSVEHALSCLTGGYPILRHNEIRNNIASLLKAVCSDVCVEPTLQPLSGELLRTSSASIEDRARLDIAAGGLYGCKFERTFFDVRVFNPLVQSNIQPSLEATYHKQEKEKRRKYEDRVIQVEQATFVPFIMSCTGGYGRAADETIKRLACMLSEKRKVPYSIMIAWIRTRLSFSMLRSSILCIRGARKLKDQTVLNPSECEAGNSQTYS